MRKFIIPTLLILPHAALAQDDGGTAPADVSYTYAEIRYLDLDRRGADGLRVGGSYRFDEDWFVFGGITDLDLDPSFDESSYEFGGGYIHDLDNGFDLVGKVSLISVDTDSFLFDGDDTGFVLAGGVRGLAAPKVEVRGFIKHVNLDNNDTYLELGGDYFFNERLSAGGTVEMAGDRDLISIGARLHF